MSYSFFFTLRTRGKSGTILPSKTNQKSAVFRKGEILILVQQKNQSVTPHHKTTITSLLIDISVNALTQEIVSLQRRVIALSIYVYTNLYSSLHLLYFNISFLHLFFSIFDIWYASHLFFIYCTVEIILLLFEHFFLFYNNLLLL